MLPANLLEACFLFAAYFNIILYTILYTLDIKLIYGQKDGTIRGERSDFYGTD